MISALILDNQKSFLFPPCDTDAVTSRNSETVPALMENLCRHTQDRLTDIYEFRAGCWEQGG